MAMASPRRNDGTRRPAPSGLVLRNEANTHEVEVDKALNQWAVTVTALADNRMICQDFFARRWEAVARAEVSFQDPPHDRYLRKLEAFQRDIRIACHRAIPEI